MGDMLIRLTIENFVLIERLDLHFQAGLTVLTGETGAGKSILLDAVEGVLGAKLHPGVVRPGAPKASLEASFIPSPAVQQWLEHQEIDPSEELVVSREVTARTSRYRINGVLVNQSVMQALRDLLIAITAQGQALSLSRPEVQLQMLDRFARGQAILDEVRSTYRRWQEAKSQLNRALTQQKDERSQKELLRQQFQELKALKITDPNEEEDLLAERDRLSHTVELTQDGQEVYRLLYRGTPSVSDQLAQASRALEAMATHDSRVQLFLEMIQTAQVQVTECARQVHQYTEELEAEPDRLEQVEQRLRDLRKICQKYGPTLQEVMAHQQHIQQQWQHLKTGSPPIEELQTGVDHAHQALHQVCETLTVARAAAAQQLEARVKESLAPLGMGKARFVVQLTPVPPGPEGAQRVEFLLSANPGQPLAPLRSVASGGEMARFLLALKVCLGEEIPTLIFDEIDVGVSGKVAQAVATHLMQLTRNHQVLCVTHQPLVAAMAHVHWRVRKVASQDQTHVFVDQLEGLPQRTEELAQMAGGHSAEQARDFVTALLAQAKELRTLTLAEPSIK